MATKTKPMRRYLVTWQNGIDFESSTKIEKLLERSLREKKQLAITGNPKWMIGNRQDGNGGRFTLWTYPVEK